MPFQIYESAARTILSPVPDFWRRLDLLTRLAPRATALSVAYCYVPTMRVQGGLQKEYWLHWGEFTTFKSNCAELLARSLRREQIIYCSPLTDPYQPAELRRRLMPEILNAVLKLPPGVFAIQTRGPLILRDLALLSNDRSYETMGMRGFSLPGDYSGVLLSRLG